MTGSLNVIRLLDHVNQIKSSLVTNWKHTRTLASCLRALLPVMVMRQVSDQLTRNKWPAFREQFSSNIRVKQKHREGLVWRILIQRNLRLRKEIAGFLVIRFSNSTYLSPSSLLLLGLMFIRVLFLLHSTVCFLFLLKLLLFVFLFVLCVLMTFLFFLLSSVTINIIIPFPSSLAMSFFFFRQL
jgi:hypothetical protein